MNRYAKYYGAAVLVLVVDQLTKLWVHHCMLPGIAGEIVVLKGLFTLRYVSNPGMAFGVEFGFPYGKLTLTFFRMAIISFLGYYLHHIITRTYAPAFRLCISLTFGGALGNLIDGLFYGIWLNNAPPTAPTPWFHGQVVDMFYIHIWSGKVPENFPLWGGEYISLWPVFNVADAAIFVSICWLMLFRKKIIKKSPAFSRFTVPRKTASE